MGCALHSLNKVRRVQVFARSGGGGGGGGGALIAAVTWLCGGRRRVTFLCAVVESAEMSRKRDEALEDAAQVRRDTITDNAYERDD